MTLAQTEQTNRPEAVPLTFPEVAQELGVHPTTVLRWAQAGRIPSYRFGPRSRRIYRRDLETFKAATGGDAA